MAEAIMAHFLVTEDHAYRLALLVEAVEIGDDLSDAVFPLHSDGDLVTALGNLATVHHRLGNAITQLSDQFSALERR
jgi:hypothetical protein